MNTAPHRIFKFGQFRFNADSLVLYHDGHIVSAVEKKSLEVLAVILKASDRFAKYEDIIQAVWPDVKYGVETTRVNQHISKLQTIFGIYDPETEFFENLRGRGYRFTADVIESESPSQTVNSESNRYKDTEARLTQKSHLSRFWKWYLLSGLFAVIVLAGFAIRQWYLPEDREEVRRVVKESQMFESLVLYKQPQQFKESDLDKYWTAELDINSNNDRGKIRQAIRKLTDEGRKYGEETKCEQFDFQTIEINENHDLATVRTLEKWQIANYSVEGALLKISQVGPYFVDYILRKIDGRWLIEKSNTARTVRPTPHLDELVTLTQPVAKSEFLVRLNGSDIEPLTINLEIIGTGCPEVKPCKVNNRTLVERSKLSATSLDNVPLSLDAGEFKIVARNGDSKPSNSVSITIP